MLPHANSDSLEAQLSQLSIPAPSAMAQADILRAARQIPPRRRGLNAKMHWLQAFLAVPQTRFAVMAMLLACVIGIGLAGQSQRDLPRIPKDMLLYDVAITDLEHDPAEGWFIGDMI